MIVRILVQAATAAPGGSLTALTRMLEAWPEADELLVAAWRTSSLEAFRGSGLQVVQLRGHSTPEAIFTARIRLRSTVRSFVPDVIWGQQYYLPGYQQPQVIHQRNLLRFTGDHSSIVSRLRDIGSAYGLRRARSLVFNSQALLKAAMERYGWLRDRDCHVVYNPVELVPEDKARRVSDAIVRVLLPQSDAPHKRCEWVPRIVASLREMDAFVAERVQVRVAGLGTYRELRAEARRLGVERNIVLLGYLSRQELVEEYRQSDLVMITSRAESFCNPVIEAHSAGRPVVAPELPVLRELQGPLLELVPSADPPRMANRVLRSIQAGEPSVTARERAKSFAAQFTSAKQAAQLRAVLQAAAG